MKQSPAWLTTGIIVFVLALSLIGSASYFEYKSCSPDWQGMCGFGIGMFNLPMTAVFMNPVLTNLPQPGLTIALVISSCLFWSALSMGVTVLVQKVKNKLPSKSVVKKKSNKKK